jgi:hypothetical protein
MFSDEGGLGTGSSSVRRSRYSRGVFAGGRAWLGACFRLLAGAFPFFREVTGVVLGDVRARAAAGFRVGAALFSFFRVVGLLVRVVPLALAVVLVVRDLAFGRLAERRSADGFVWVFAFCPPRRADRLAICDPFQ